MKISRFIALGLLVFACTAPAAKADDGLNNLGLAYLFGYGNVNQAGVRSFGPAPPYFSLHPPVYYGQRYTRPYGASPFAAWPQLQSNPSFAPAPHVNRAQTIINPHGGTAAEPIHGVVQSRKLVEPLVIENPYFEPSIQYTATDSKD